VVSRLLDFRAVYHRRLGFNARAYESPDDPLDIASNIVGYLPLGIILGALGPLRRSSSPVSSRAVSKPGSWS